MGTPIQMNVDSFLAERRKVLGIPDTSMVPDDIPEENRNLIMEGIKGGFGLLKDGIGKVQDFRESQLESMSPGEKDMLEQIESSSDPGMLKFLSPGGLKTVGTAVKVADKVRNIPGPASRGIRSNVARRLSPFRAKGSKASTQIEQAAAKKIKPKIQKSEAGRYLGDPKLVERLKDTGYDIWSKDLGGMNPSQFDKLLSGYSGADRVFIQQGALKSLGENLANMPRLTKSAQTNLLSPAGRVRLTETFKGLPPETMETFIRLVETGKHQNAARFALGAGLIFQIYRAAGRRVLETLGIGRSGGGN